MTHKELRDIVKDISSIRTSIDKTGKVCFKLHRFILGLPPFEYKEFILGIAAELLVSLDEISNDILHKAVNPLSNYENMYYFPSLDIIGTVKIGARIAIIQRCNQLDTYLTDLPDETKDILKGLIVSLALNLYEEAFKSGMEYNNIFMED